MLTQDELVELMNERPGPCLSLYQHTHRHHPDNAQDPIRFGNLVKRLEESLVRHPVQERDTLLDPFRHVQHDADFWNHTLDGLVVLSAPGASRVLRLPRPVADFAVVADSWHIKPLLRIHQSVDRFQLLCLTRDRVWLYEGNRDAIDEVALAQGVPRTIGEALGEELTEPYQKVSTYGMGPAGAGRDMRHGHGGRKDELDKDTERFFRAIDRAILEHHSRRDRLPLLLVCLPEYQGIFRQLTHNPFLLPDAIPADPAALDIGQLRDRAWAAMEPSYRRRIAEAVEAFHGALAKGLASEQLDDVASAAFAGRVDTVLVDAARQIPGRLDPASARVHRSPDLSDAHSDDVLDDLLELVIRRGGNAMVLPAPCMPSTSGIAAIFRY